MSIGPFAGTGWSRLLAALAAIVVVSSFFEETASATFVLRHDGVHVFTGIALILISMILILIRSALGLASRVADIAVSILHLLVLILWRQNTHSAVFAFLIHHSMESVAANPGVPRAPDACGLIPTR